MHFSLCDLKICQWCKTSTTHIINLFFFVAYDAAEDASYYMKIICVLTGSVCTYI